MIFPGQALKFSEEDLETLGIEIKVLLDDLETQHETLYEGIEKAWCAYEAEKQSEKKNFPWAGASNVMIPIVMIHVNATLSRYLTMVKSNENIWVGRSDNEEFVKGGFVIEIPRFLNWAARGNEFDFDTPTSDWMLEVINCGEGVITLGWENKSAEVLIPGEKKTQTVGYKSGPMVEHIPRENCLWDRNYRAWEAPLFSRKSLLSWSDMVRRVNEGGWDWDVVEGVKGETEAYSGTAAGKVTEDKDRRSGVERSQSYGLYDWREVWVDWPTVARSAGVKPPEDMEEGDGLTTIVVFQHRRSGKIAKVCAKPYLHPYNPFFDAYFKKRSGIHSSSGLGLILYDIQEACATFVNQSADAVTKANSTSGVTSQAQMADVDIAINKFALVDDVSEIQEFGNAKNIGPDMALFAQLNVIAERITGINDPGLGRETRMGGHPAPATSTLSLLQEGKKLDLVGIRSIRQAISKLGEYLAVLYQQYEKNPQKIMRAVGAEDGQKVLEWMFPDKDTPLVGNLELDLAAISETMNPQMEQQKALAMFQITSNFYALVTQFLQLASNPKAPPTLVMAMVKGLQALQESYKKILESSDIDDIKSFTLDLDQLTQQLSQSRQQAQGAAQGSPPGGPQGPPPGAQGGQGPGIGSGL